MQNVTKVQYFTKEDLLKANKEAKKLNFNRALNDQYLIDHLEEGTKYPVSVVFEHDHHARIKVVLNAKGTEAWLDISWDRLKALPVTWCDAPAIHAN